MLFGLLDFIREFLQQLGDLSDVDKTACSCQDAYNKTLAKHHPWVIRKAAIVAMYTMPTREALFKKVNELITDNLFYGKFMEWNLFYLHLILRFAVKMFNGTSMFCPKCWR